ncbi:MAG: thiol-disulfide isomerase-like thioredoxin [Phycisphaerales bacterium]|nr:thiol-disulfide isomerase-like thioredoxin [Phycisphaerales bacterium]
MNVTRRFVLTGLFLVVGISVAVRAEPKEKEASKVDDLAHEGYWLKDKEAAYKKAMAMLNKPAPALQLANWHGKPVTPADRKGKIVLVDFWATWCGPCLEQIPHANEMKNKYADKGVIVYGACCARGAETMSKTAVDKGMEYPTGKLSDKATTDWGINFWPTYAVIDREGNLRAIGLEPGYVEKVLDELLTEQPPKADDKEEPKK